MLFDPIYWIIIIVSIVLSGGAAMLVKAQFARGSRVRVARGMSGAQVAAAILRHADIHDVTIEEHQGFLSDHYNPMSKTLALSPDVYHGTHAAAVGVAAHEVGHAIQHAHGYVPMWMRSVLVPVANIGSGLAPWIIIAGIMLGSAAQAEAGQFGLAYWLAVGGVILFGAATLFTLVTVPVEFNASSRAKEHLLAMDIVREGEEASAVRGVLTAAGLTYVAAAVSSILFLLYWAFQAGLLGGRRE